jgi:hypothetical protein
MTPAADDERRNRPLAAVIVLFIALAAIASLVIVSAFRFDVPAVGRFSALIGGGGASLELLRWGAILDLGSYLTMGVVILFLGERLRAHSPGVVAALTTSGLGAVLVGAIGAAVLASVGPWLLSEHASGSPSVRDAARVGLDAMGRIVLAGLWGTLELSMLGAWLFGIGWLQRGGSPRQAALALFGGAAMVASSLRTGLTGRSLVEVAGPLDLIVVLATFVGFAALFGWLLAVALTLWRAPAART